MKHGPDRHHRRSIRLRGYDYRQAGAYFLTICTDQRECILGDIIDDKMRLSALGRIAERNWIALAEHFVDVELDAFIVMPNHLHGILVLVGADVDREHERRPRDNAGEQFGSPVKGSVPTIVRTFKAAVTRDWNNELSHPMRRIWQRNYYEHVIRDEGDLERIRAYIAGNPGQWRADRYYAGIEEDRLND